MATKNLMDANKSNERPLVFDDKTGQYKTEPRMELDQALQFVHEVYKQMLAASNPAVCRFEIQFALQSICQHTGWLPYEIAAAEQYAAMLTPSGSAASAG